MCVFKGKEVLGAQMESVAGRLNEGDCPGLVERAGEV